MEAKKKSVDPDEAFKLHIERIVSTKQHVVYFIGGQWRGIRDFQTMDLDEE